MAFLTLPYTLFGDLFIGQPAHFSLVYDPTPARIKGLVQKIINDIFIDGQLDECELTLKDLNEIAKSFNIILNAVYHHRIEYPESQPEGERQKNGGSSTKSANKAKGKIGRGQGNGRKDIKRFGVSRE